MLAQRKDISPATIMLLCINITKAQALGNPLFTDDHTYNSFANETWVSLIIITVHMYVCI